MIGRLYAALRAVPGWFEQQAIRRLRDEHAPTLHSASHTLWCPRCDTDWPCPALTYGDPERGHR